MSEIKSLADQLRSSISDQKVMPVVPVVKKRADGKSNPGAVEVSPIYRELLGYDTADHKSMVHARLDAKTALMLNHFKMATGVDNIKVVAFAVKHLFATQPELKKLIKNFIETLEL
ncbi:MAG TPA: hypothetical protein VK541_20420 [Pedobacter sp.]|uniref:hypothetical protein n=1 Tax=Pedobacter sp. TaxID=1411316 RepID=UPI002B6A22C3|nr:hypothetical protein [Pedobacter sp.]HMI04865.1 hypothetical protein [Pedobacter sp.]